MKRRQETTVKGWITLSLFFIAMIALVAFAFYEEWFGPYHITGWWP